MHISFRSFRRILLFCICICCTIRGVQAQGRYIYGTVAAKTTGERIPLASVAWKRVARGGITDSTGHFRIMGSNGPDTLVISCVGYNSVSIPVDPADTLEYYVELPGKQAEKIEVTARYNRGLLWWKQMVRHKAANNPHKVNFFSSDLYRKLELDLNNLSREKFEKTRLLKPFSFIADNIDTVSGSSPFLPIFIKESTSRYYSSAHPHKKREEITAVRTSGMNNESVLHIIGGLEQSVNVYENYITLFGKEFISPLSSSGDAHYQYRGADTQYIGGQRYLHLLFSPRHVGENTFSGSCWIHQPTWAVHKIDLDISTTADINFVHRLTIRQEFRLQPDSSWIFFRDQYVAEISPLNKEKLSLIARQTCLYAQVHIDQPGIAHILEGNTQPDQVIEAVDSRNQSPAWWESRRPELLSANEKNIYKMVDTLKTIPAFQAYTRTVEFMIDGHKKFGKVEIGPWYKWISGNRREKLRLRFDLGTTDRFSKQLRLHGYLAYGTADNQFKGATDARYLFPGNGGYSVEAAWMHDLDNGRSRNDDDGITTDNLFSQLIRRPGIRQKFIGVDEIRTGAGKEWRNSLSLRLLVSRASYTTFNPLPPQKMISPNEKDIISTEIGLRLRYAPREKKTSMAHKDVRTSGDHPVFELGVAAGIPGIAGSQYTYRKANALVTQNIHLPGWGQVSYQLYGGRIWGEPLPFMLLQVHPGNETWYYSRQAFNLMSRFEYISDRYAGFTVEHHFDRKLLNMLPLLRKTKVRQFWNCKAVWGDLCPANKRLNRWEYGAYHMRSLNGKPYIETGTGVDNIFTYFRLDCVWRFTPGQPGSLTSNIARPDHRFGVFGSFHLQF